MIDYIHGEELRNDVLSTPELQKYIEDLATVRKEYDNRIISELPFSQFRDYYVSGNRVNYEHAYFERRKRLVTLALTSWLYGREEDLRQLEEVLWAVCNEYTWALPAHMDIDKPLTIDLFAAETAFALSEICYLLSNKLDRPVKDRCRKETKRRVLDEYMGAKEAYNWEDMSNNWCAVCAGSIAVSAMYMMEDEYIDPLLDKLEPTFQHFLDSFGSDGTCLEGLSYWTYGLSFYFAFLDLLRIKRPERAFSMMHVGKLQKIVEFQQKCYFKGGETVSFSDSSHTELYRRGLTYYLASHYSNVIVPPGHRVAQYDTDPCFRWCNGIRDLVWTVQYKGPAVSMKEETFDSYRLPDAQWLVSSSSYPYELAAKGGSNNEAHNHNDMGSFIFYKNDYEILTDLGAGEYTKDYFNENRYTIFCNRSLSHNVPIIEEHEQKAGIDSKATLLVLEKNHIRTELSAGYDIEGLEEYIRDLHVEKKQGLKIMDSFKFSGDCMKVTERFVSKIKPVRVGNQVVFEIGDNEKVDLENSRNRQEYLAIVRPKGTRGLVDICLTEYEHVGHDSSIITVYIIDFEYVVSESMRTITFEVY